MIYRQRNKKRNISFKIILFVIAIFVILRIFNLNIFDGFIKNTFNQVLHSKSVVSSPLREVVNYFDSKARLAKENEELKTENTNLKLSLLTETVANEEYDLFKEQFVNWSTSTSAIKVILKPPFMPFDIIRLGGDLSEYEVGNLVFYQNVIIGSVVEKTGRYASVELFSTPGKVTPALINGTQFEARGLGGGRYLIEVAKDFEIQEQDAIIYPHEKVILLGVVGEIESNEEDLFKKVYFNTPVALTSISYVTIGATSYEQTEFTN